MELVRELQMVRHNLTLGPGQEADIPGPCCTWARFEVLITATLAPIVAPAAGSFDTMRLMRDAITNSNTPSDLETVAFGVIAANLAAGMVTRIDRRFPTGIYGIRLRNNLNVAVYSVQVEFRPYTAHSIEV